MLACPAHPKGRFLPLKFDFLTIFGRISTAPDLRRCPPGRLPISAARRCAPMIPARPVTSRARKRSSRNCRTGIVRGDRDQSTPIFHANCGCNRLLRPYCDGACNCWKIHRSIVGAGQLSLLWCCFGRRATSGHRNAPDHPEYIFLGTVAEVCLLGSSRPAPDT